jgi:hypothetical protein
MNTLFDLINEAQAVILEFEEITGKADDYNSGFIQGMHYALELNCQVEKVRELKAANKTFKKLKKLRKGK